VRQVNKAYRHVFCKLKKLAWFSGEAYRFAWYHVWILCCPVNSGIVQVTNSILITSSVVVEALCYKPECHGFETRWSNLVFSIYLILPASLGLGVYSPSNRNEYHKQKKCFWGVQRDWFVRLTTLPAFWADCLDNVGSSTSHNPIGIHGLLRG
jgi:hypothetical protein